MKKIISILLVVVVVLSAFSGCGTTNKKDNDKIKILTTIFPIYDWTRNIVSENDNVELDMLLDNGVDLHSFQPTADDIINISTCNVFIYVGGESDKWVDDALKEAVNKDMIVVDLLDVLGASAKEEEVVEGMQAEEEEGEDEAEFDEHIWLSLKNASILCKAIEEAISKADTVNEAEYSANADSYIEKINALDKQFESTVNESANKTILVGDRFPFRYLVDDYGINYFAAFVGCSAESEASFETISFLSKKVDELNLNTVLTTENSNQKIAKTIVASSKNKNAKIMSMYSMQSVTKNDVDGGATYLSFMEQNLSTLKEALK